MENDILVALEDLGYQGPLLEDGTLETAVSGGAASPEFTKLCAWIISELRLYCKLEENVQATNCPSEADGFQLEMSGLLSELACPYSVLTTGDVTQRLCNRTNCLLLLTFLVSELEASRMILVNKPKEKSQESAGSPVFQELKGICVALGMSKPPANITMFQFFSGIEKKLKEALTRVPASHVGEPLMKKQLGPVHMEKVEAVNQALVNEYEVRRKMLLKRMDVTVQSFGWSDRAKMHTEKMVRIYHPLRAVLCTKSKVSVSHLLAAREDLSKILRTSSGKIRERTACAINKVLMGRVPDRGGRPCEIEPPPPEMPSWQKRQDGPQGGGGFGGAGRGSGGGGRGGYEQYSQGGRGGYERGGGGYGERGGRGGRGGGGGGGGRGGGGYHQSYHQDGGGHQGGTGRGGYGGGSYQGGFQDPGYSGGGGGGGGGGGYHDNYNQDGSRHQDRGGSRGGRGGRGRGGRGGGGQGGGWGMRGGQNFNQGGQFEQYFQQGGQQYNQAGFGQGRLYSS